MWYICSSLTHQHSCVFYFFGTEIFMSKIKSIKLLLLFKSKIYYCWPPLSILLMFFEKNICILDLLRILVCDMVANARNVNSFRC